MCGFSGIISNSILNQHLIVDSISTIKHRGPNDTLIFSGDQKFYACHLSNPDSKIKYPLLPIDKSADKLFAFNRLSIVDLSENGMQPFFDAEKEIVFMLNGEIYNYAELKTEYLADEPFISQSDSEVAFRLYLKFGDNFIKLMRGMFSIVVYNFKTNQLKAWRDRLGMKPFYYAFANGTFVFSSEMKGIFATNLIKKEINYQGLAYSMYLSTCPSPLTIYKNINSLQAGCKLGYSQQSGEIQIDHYWRLEYHPSKRAIEFNEFNTDLQELCRLHQTGDVEKALMLSGGMDSGTLAHYFSKFDHNLKCLNIYATNHLIDEREFALENAKNAQLNLTFLEIPPEPSELQISETLLAEEEPNSLPEPAIFLCDQANKMGIKVLYNALGPDELFGGYQYFATINRYKKISSLLKFIPEILVPERHKTKFSEVKKYGFEQYPIICRKLFTWEQITQFLKFKGDKIPVHPIEFINNQVNTIYPEFKTLPLMKKVSYMEIFYYIASHHTFRSDQPSMRYSIEMRFPFLDHLFIEKYFNQTDTFQNIGKYLKPQFKEYVSNVLPSKIFEMSKRGFSMPTENWANENKNNELTGIEATTPTQHWYLNMLNEITKTNQNE